MRHLLAATALVLCAATVHAAPRPSPGCARDTIEHGRRLERTLTVHGAERRVTLDVPDSVRPGTPVPLLLDFHGFGHSGSGMWRVSPFKALAETAGFITAYPDGLPVTLNLRGEASTGPGWQFHGLDDNRDLEFTRALLDDLERRYCLDRGRIYATGFSNGAYFTQVLACAMADRVAAIAPVGGGALPYPCTPSRPVPILIQHGSEDTLIPPDWARRARDQWRKIDGCTGDASRADGATCERWTCRAGTAVAYCEEAYAHHWPPQAAQRVWDFVSRYRIAAQP